MLLLIGILIGLMLSLTGAGGSVFAVPLLIVIAGLDIHQAIGLSLLAVAASTIFGSIRSSKRQQVLWLPTIMLSVSGMIVIPAGQWLASQLSETLLIIGFSVLAMLIAVRMWYLSVSQPAMAAVTRGSDFIEADGDGLLCRFSATGHFKCGHAASAAYLLAAY